MDSDYTLNWRKVDPEARFGLPAKKFTGVHASVSFCLGGLLTALFYLALYPVWRLQSFPMVDMFFHGGDAERSTIPYYTMFLTFWCVAFILIKWRKIAVQRQALKIAILPENIDFVLSPDTSAQVLRRIREQVYMPEAFLVFNRIQKALSNLKNIGRVSDVSSVLNDLATADEKFLEATYTLPKGLIWAIPVTGFIGTVLGLSKAVGGFGRVVAGGADIETLKNALSGVTGGLAVAFETTLIALVAALLVQLLLTMLMQKEEELLDECATYCHENVVARLKLLDMKDDL